MEFGIIQIIEKRKTTIWNGDINIKTINFINKINQQKDKFDLNLYPFFLDHIAKPYTDVTISDNHIILITQKMNLIRIDITDFQIEKIQIPHYSKNKYQSNIIKYLQQIHDAQLINIDLIQIDALIKVIIINVIPFQFNNIELSFFIRTRGQLPISDKLKNQFLLTTSQSQINEINDQILDGLSFKELQDYHNKLQQEDTIWYQQIEEIQILDKGITFQYLQDEDITNRRIIKEKLLEKLSIDQIILIIQGFSKDELTQGNNYSDYHEKGKILKEQQPLINLIGQYLSQKQDYDEKLKQQYKINKDEINKIKEEEIQKKQKFEKQNQEMKDEIINENLEDDDTEIIIEEPILTEDPNRKDFPITENSSIQDILNKIKDNYQRQQSFNDTLSRLFKAVPIPKELKNNQNIIQRFNYETYQNIIQSSTFNILERNIQGYILDQMRELLKERGKQNILIYSELENSSNKYLRYQEYNWKDKSIITKQDFPLSINIEKWTKQEILTSIILNEPFKLTNTNSEEMILNLQLLQGFQQFIKEIQFQQDTKKRRAYNQNTGFTKIFVKFKDQGNNTCLLRALMVPLIVNRKFIIENQSLKNEELEFDWTNLPPPQINGVYGNIEDIISFIGNVSIKDTYGRRQLGILGKEKSEQIKISDQEAIIVSIQQKFQINELLPDNNSGILVLKNRDNHHWESDYYFGQKRFTNTSYSERWTTYVIIKFGSKITSLLGEQISSNKKKVYDSFVIKPSTYHTPKYSEIYNITFTSGNFYHTRSADYWKKNKILQT